MLYDKAEDGTEEVLRDGITESFTSLWLHIHRQLNSNYEPGDNITS